MSRAIADALRDAAHGPTPFDPMVARSWVGMHTPAHIWLLYFSGDPIQVMAGLTDDECRMYLLFCSYAAEDEE